MFGMEWMEDPEIGEALQEAVYFGCLDYRETLTAAGFECPVYRGMSRRARAIATEEVYHEFALHLENRGVDFSTVDCLPAYLRRAFRNFAEGIREDVQRFQVSFGDLEGDRSPEGEDRCGPADEVAQAGRERAIERFSEGEAATEDPGEAWGRSLDRGTEHERLMWLLENYPLARYSEGLLARLRAYYRSRFGEAFPEEFADALWEKDRGEEFARVLQRLALTRASLSDLRGKRSAASRLAPEEVEALDARIQKLLDRQAELERRSRILARFMPRQVYLLLPASGRPSIGALTVALFRARQIIVRE